MSSQHIARFKTTILQMGNNTGIEVPEKIVEQFGAGKKPPVKVTLHQYSYQSTVAVMGGKYLIPVSADVRNKSGVNGGDTLTVQLELDLAPRVVAIHPEFLLALKKEKKAMAFFESLSNSNKKKYTLPIEEAKTDETRERRIQKAMADLKAGKKL